MTVATPSPDTKCRTSEHLTRSQRSCSSHDDHHHLVSIQCENCILDILERRANHLPLGIGRLQIINTEVSHKHVHIL